VRKHEYFIELVNLKIDNMLTAEQDIELDEHLQSCSECSDRLRVYELLHNFSADLLVSPPEGFRNDVMDKIQSTKKIHLPKRQIFSRIVPLIGAAAVLALVLYTGVYEYLFPTKSMSKYDAPLEAAYASKSEDESPMATAMVIDGGSSIDESYSGSITREGSGKEVTEDEAKASIEYHKGLFAGNDKMSEKGSNLFDTATAKVGDEVAGFVITDIATEDYNGGSSVIIAFDGEATLSGTLYHDNNELGYWGKFIYFYIDDDCAEFLPYPVDDDRQIWFGFDNYDEAVEMLETMPEDEGQTIAYQAVITIDSYTVVQGASEGCNFATLKSILSLNRLDD